MALITKKPKAHGNADGLFHLPVKEPSVIEIEPTEIVNLFQLEYALVTCSIIEQGTKKSPTLAHVYGSHPERLERYRQS